MPDSGERRGPSSSSCLSERSDRWHRRRRSRSKSVGVGGDSQRQEREKASDRVILGKKKFLEAFVMSCPVG